MNSTVFSENLFVFFCFVVFWRGAQCIFTDLLLIQHAFSFCVNEFSWNVMTCVSVQMCFLCLLLARFLFVIQSYSSLFVLLYFILVRLFCYCYYYYSIPVSFLLLIFRVCQFCCCCCYYYYLYYYYYLPVCFLMREGRGGGLGGGKQRNL